MGWLVTHRERLGSLFGTYYPPDTARAILRLIRPALRLTVAGTPPGRSRLGGPPLLPPGLAWPCWAGRRLDLLAGIDFTETARVLRLPGLPGTGSACFYYAAEIPRPWGDDPAERDGWRVLSGPGALASGTGAGDRPALPLAAEPLLSLPGPYEPSLRELDATWPGFLDVYQQLYEAWLRFVWADLPRHQLAGWPVLVQRSLGEDQRLLLQLDSDERSGWCWGHPGTVYFHARAADLRSGALDRCRLTLQAR
jgi:uncharacterized protein YwqG